MKFAGLIGRILFGGYFTISGIHHFLKLEMMAGYAESKGVPMPTIAIIGSGLLILVGGILILFGWKAHIGAWLIVLFLIPVTIMMHNFWAVTDSAARQGELINFMKNMGLLGASLMIASVRYWPLALERPAAGRTTASPLG